MGRIFEPCGKESRRCDARCVSNSSQVRSQSAHVVGLVPFLEDYPRRNDRALLRNRGVFTWHYLVSPFVLAKSGPALDLYTRSVDVCTGARADIN